MNRNQFESILCVLREGLDNKSKMYEIHGHTISKGRGYFVFKFEVIFFFYFSIIFCLKHSFSFNEMLFSKKCQLHELLHIIFF